MRPADARKPANTANNPGVVWARSPGRAESSEVRAELPIATVKRPVEEGDWVRVSPRGVLLGTLAVCFLLSAGGIAWLQRNAANRGAGDAEEARPAHVAARERAATAPEVKTELGAPQVIRPISATSIESCDDGAEGSSVMPAEVLVPVPEPALHGAGLGGVIVPEDSSGAGPADGQRK